MSEFISVDVDLVVAYGIPVATAEQLETLRIAMSGVAPAREATRRPRAPRTAQHQAVARTAYRSRLRLLRTDPSPDLYDG